MKKVVHFMKKFEHVLKNKQDASAKSDELQNNLDDI
jgi:hypothetical protein